MKVKQMLAGTGLLVVGYQTGKIVAHVKDIKIALDAAESFAPGAKKTILKIVADKLIDNMFKTNKDEEA